MTPLILHHPGGKKVIVEHLGKDISRVFDANHHSLKTKETLLRLKTLSNAMHSITALSASHDSDVQQWTPAIRSFLPELCFFYDDELKGLVQSIPNRLMDDTFRAAVDVMEGKFAEIASKVNANSLTPQQLEMLHADLSYIGTAYVVGKDEDSKINYLPTVFGNLWVKVSGLVGRKPMMDYSDCVLNNWAKDASGNVHMLRRFSGVYDEENFFMLHLLAERNFDDIIRLIARFKNAAVHGDSDDMLHILTELKSWVDTIIVQTFRGMEKKCRPDVFWHVVRRFLGSWENVHYGEDVGNLSFSGPTGAHTSTIALMDAFLGVPDADGPLAEKLADFDGRRPPAHRHLVSAVKQEVNARAVLTDGAFVSDQQYVPLLHAFNALAISVIKLRDEHITLVQKYILHYVPKAVGTGGTDPMTMLGGRRKQAIDALIVEKPLKVDPVAYGLLEAGEAEVSPWDVKGRVDYNKLIAHFGCEYITDQQKARLLAIAQKNGVNKLHHLIERGVFFSHRDLNLLLDAIERGEEVYIYTGRGPSGGMHIGHLLPFQFTCWLQSALNAKVVIQMTDDEKFLFREMEVSDVEYALRDNIRDIIAVGFDPERTFIFSNFAYMGVMYPLVARIQKLVSANQLKGAFGFDGSDNIGMWAFAPTQAAPSFSDAFPHFLPQGKNMWCLIPQAIDQDPYFRLTRDVAPKLKYNKPVLIHSKFFTSLQGPKGKMSAHDPTSAIFLTDTPDQVRTKIMKYAFSGGQATAEEQRRLGADLEVDVSYQIMFHFCEDNEYVAKIGDEYRSGKMMTAKMKGVAAEFVQKLIAAHQDARSKVTDDIIDKFTKFNPSLRSTISALIPS